MFNVYNVSEALNVRARRWKQRKEVKDVFVPVVARVARENRRRDALGI